MSFKKKVITINNEGLKQAEKVAEAKITLLQSAMKEAEKHIEITYFKEFSEDFIAYTTKKVLDKNKGLKELNLTSDKVLNLLEINLNKLYEIQVEFEENKTKVYFDKDGSPFTKVDKEQFISWTKNEEENERLEAFQYLILSVEEIQKYTHVYKGEIATLTSNAVRFDLRLNKWIINPINFR